MIKMSPKDSDYPKRLAQLGNPPKTLYISCNNWPNLSNRPMLAVVGSRRPSSYGMAVCHQLSSEAAKRGTVIVSGLALGIDSVAHKAALDAGGQTIAVLPAGFDNIYPASHRNLAKLIVEQGGALVSEYRPDEKIAFKGNFIARNRIIAGLSNALLVPEAAEKSGSLHTARFALDLGVEVLAVPGQITNSLATGSNNLIKSGATMVTNIRDLLAPLNIDEKANQSVKISSSNPEEYLILTIINNGTHDGDEIMKLSKLSIDKFNQTITMLEINGQIKPGGANNWYLN